VVPAEWETAYLDEITNQKVKIIPLLIESCDIPPFLKIKKYIDFRENYGHNLSYLLNPICRLYLNYV